VATKTQETAPRWEFKARFRRHSFGWRSQPAVLRVRQAVTEIRQAARRSPVTGAEGAVTLLERLSPAVEQVDSSSGAIGTAVNHAIATLVPIIGDAPAPAVVRAAWLERLWTAYQSDQMPYLEALGDHWGELCSSPETASAWADRLLFATRMALAPDRGPHGYFPGSSACLSALHFAGRHQEIIDIVPPGSMWGYRRWMVRALVALGRAPEAIQCAEACRGPWTPDGDVDRVCEQVLLSSGRTDESYARYGLRANRGPTYLATFRAVARKYPNVAPRQVLADLVASTPGEEGKWFAAAREAATPEEALALRWMARGWGHDLTAADAGAPYAHALAAATGTGGAQGLRERVRHLITEEDGGGWLAEALGPEWAR